VPAGTNPTKLAPAPYAVGVARHALTRSYPSAVRQGLLGLTRALPTFVLQFTVVDGNNRRSTSSLHTDSKLNIGELAPGDGPYQAPSPFPRLTFQRGDGARQARTCTADTTIAIRR